ncbi:YbgA family protein [Macrococcus armenti]|uniref:YbgA family protein n=1 Tax=Macrococcus armenti TaxID=2875764 RepID=UPI001CCB36A6|nr:YbgA family protein [Macrococcus armenti]UBH22440.1 YbgA family protein [Macrococcus armenti]
MNKLHRKQVELLWKHEKYKVMYYSQRQYLYIRTRLNEGLDDLAELKQILTTTYSMKPTQGSMRNSFEHMWGYFKKQATPEEKENFFSLCTEVLINDKEIKRFLYHLAQKYDVTYLKESTILLDEM